MSKLFPEDYGFFPRTWILPNEINELRYVYQESIINSLENQQEKTRFPQFKAIK